MARNTFHFDSDKLRAELEALGDDELYERYEDANDSLHGDGSFDNDTVQDCAILEEMAIEDRAVIRIAGELLKQRGVINQFGIRIATPQGEPPQGQGLDM